MQAGNKSDNKSGDGTRHETGDGSLQPGFGVYLHWPFCASKCPYCDFNSHVRMNGIDEARFLAGYLSEIAHMASLSPHHPGAPAVSSIFFGGGTPSLMAPSTVAAILDCIARHWPIDETAEITLEANPSSVEAQRFKDYRAAGINRVSLGVQSLYDKDLKALGRLHSADEARQAIAIAGTTFERFSFDLIYARPGQTLNAWERELDAALALAQGALSLYQLTIEDGTPFAALHRAGKLIVPEGEPAHDLYQLTQDMTAARGLPAYEISNHAAAGQESRHNLLYWRYGTYAGIGAGAHGRLLVGGQRLATVTLANPEGWLADVEARGHALVSQSRLTAAEQADEILLMGLRLREGIDLTRLRQITGLAPQEAVLADLVRDGLIEPPAPAPRAGAGDGAAAGAGSEAGAEAGDGAAAGAEAGAEYGDPAKPTAASRLRVTRRGRFILNQVVLRVSQSLTAAGADGADTPRAAPAAMASRG